MTARVAAFLRAFAVAIAVLVSLVAGARTAAAWVELTVSNDDIHVTVEASGKARVEHRVTLLVSGGPLREVLIKGVDADADVEPDGYVALEKDASKKDGGATLPIATQRVTAPQGSDGAPPRTDLKVTLAGGEGIKRGTYVLFVRYATDLKAQKTLTPDGASSQIRWIGPAWDDGLDATKATFDLPAAPTAPKVPEVSDDDAAALDGGTLLSTVHRDGKRDVVELARPYAPKAERVVWSMRVDARAFEVGPTVTEKPKRQESPHGLKVGTFGDPRDGIFIGLGLALFALMALLVAAKSFEVRRLAAERGGKEIPLVPLPVFLRAPLAGLALVGGVVIEMTHKSSLPGAGLVALATLLAIERAPRYKAELRGPGQWLPVSIAEALGAKPELPTARFDASTWTGRCFLGVLLATIGACSVLLWPMSRYYAVLAALDATPFLGVFFTGRLDQLAPDLTREPILFFRKAIRLVEKREPTTRIVPRVRVPTGSADADELRIAFLPPRPARGLFALELAVSYAPGIGGYSMMPELLVRYQARSDCETRAQGLAQHGRIQRGRRPDERVLSISPKLPTARMTADLVVALLGALTAEARASLPGQEAPKASVPRTKKPLAA